MLLPCDGIGLLWAEVLMTWQEAGQQHEASHGIGLLVVAERPPAQHEFGQQLEALVQSNHTLQAVPGFQVAQRE